MSKIYPNLSKNEIYWWRLRYLSDHKTGITLAWERQEGNGKLLNQTKLYPLPCLYLFTLFLNPLYPTLTVPTLSSCPSFHPSHWLSLCVRITTDTPSVGPGKNTCSPLPARTFYSGSACRHQAPFTPTVHLFLLVCPHCHPHWLWQPPQLIQS